MKRLYQILIAAASSLQSPFLLLIRVYWGIQMHVTGRGKLHGIGHVVDFFTTLGIPFPAFNAYFVAWLEFIGGFLLIVGLASRPVALLLAIDMIVAYFTADREALMSFASDPDKFIAAAPFAFLFTTLVVLIFGPGKLSADALISRFFKNK